MNAEHLNSTPARWWSLLGLVLVPLLVAGGFLVAGVNADTRLKTVPAAVVNLDEPVTINGQYTPLGRQLTANLVDSTRLENLDWTLASESDARAGLATGHYAAMVVIPKNFSAAATSFAGEAGRAEQATLQLHTSPVTGVADATLGKVVAAAAATTLNQTLTEGYLDQVYVGFNDLGDQFVTLADGSAQLADGGEKLADGLREANAGGYQLAQGGEQLASGLDTYVGGVDQLVDQTVAALPKQVELAGGVDLLSQGAGGVSSGLATYRAGLNDQADQLRAVSAQIGQALMAGQTQVAVGLIEAACADLKPVDASQLGTKGPLCLAGLAGAAKGLDGAAAALAAPDPGTGQSLLSGSAAVAGGLSTLSKELAKAAPDVPAVTAQLKQLKGGGAKLADGAAELADGLGKFSDGINAAASGSTDLAGGLREMADGIAEGKDKLPAYSKAERQKLAAVVAAPINTGALTGLADANVGWISLVLVLALWLGALATFSVIKAISRGLLASAEPTPLLIGRSLLPGLAVVGAQALVVAALAQFGLALTPQKWLAVTGVLLLAGVTFVVVNHALVAWWGGLGRLVSVLFAVLTSAAALTAAAPQVFAALRPFSPLTPALDAVRAVVTESGAAVTSTLVLVGWLLLGLTASSVAIARRRSTTLAAVLATD